MFRATKQKKLKIVKNSAAIILILTILKVNVFSEEINKGTNTRVLLIGIDGLEWSIIKRLVKEHKMPTFAELMQRGAYADLHTFLEYTSPSLWTTIATGKLPEAHGITQHIIHEKGLYEPISPTSYHRKVKALWNILSDYKKSVGVINYPCTEPAEIVNGFIVPNDILRIKDTFPDKLTEEVNSITESSADTKKEFFNDFKSYPSYQDKLSEELKSHLFDGQIWSLSVMTPYLYQKFNKNLDLLMVYLYDTDYISHIFWKFMEPKFFQHRAWGLNSDNIVKYGNVIKEMYQNVDKFIKKIIREVADEDTVIVICSDHGFRNGPSIPRISFSNLNKLLEKLGVLNFKSANTDEASEVDFLKSRAYHYEFDEPHSHSSIFVSINLKGRQPNGIVESGNEYTNLKMDLINALSDLTITETNEKLFKSVVATSLSEADIQLSLRNDITLIGQHIRINGENWPLSEFYRVMDKSGDHSDPGVIIIYGKNIKQGMINGSAYILDITPTILYLLGLPVDRDMEGKVLTVAVKDDFLKANPVKYISTYETGKVTKQPYDKSAPLPIDNQQLENLKSLGYVQ